jgi:hypothetical protein
VEQVTDLATTRTADDTPDLDVERGSAFGMRDLLFADYRDGTVFDYGEFEAGDVAAMLDREGKARTLEQVLTLPIRSAAWSIEPAPGDRGEAEFITDALTRPAQAGGMSTPMALVIAQATSARLYRRACFEKVFGARDGRIVYQKLAFRQAVTVDVARDPQTAAFRGFRQRQYGMPMPNQSLVPVRVEAPYAFVHFANQHRDPIRGASDMTVPLWCHTTKNKVRFMWYQFLETQAGPRTVVTDTQGETSAKANAKRVAQAKNGGVIGVPGQVSIDTIESNGTGAATFLQAMDYLDSEMSGSVLAGFTDLTRAAGAGRGSYALADSVTDFFLLASTAYASELAADISNFVVADLVRYNFGADAAFPQFRFAPLREADLEPLMKLLEMGQAPATKLPPEFLEEITVKVAGFLDMDTDLVRKAMRTAGEQAQRHATTEQEARVADVAGQIGMAEDLTRTAIAAA